MSEFGVGRVFGGLGLVPTENVGLEFGVWRLRGNGVGGGFGVERLGMRI